MKSALFTLFPIHCHGFAATVRGVVWTSDRNPQLTPIDRRVVHTRLIIATVALALFQSQLCAQLVISTNGPPPNQTTATTNLLYELDCDSNGSIDFQIIESKTIFLTYQRDAVPIYWHTSRRVKHSIELIPTDGNNFYEANYKYGFGLDALLTNGFVLRPLFDSDRWKSDRLSLLELSWVRERGLLSHSGEGGYSDDGTGPWDPENTMNLGLRFKSQFGQHAGWIQLTREPIDFYSVDETSFRITITSIKTGYQPLPGVELKVGEQPPFQPSLTIRSDPKNLNGVTFRTINLAPGYFLEWLQPINPPSWTRTTIAAAVEFHVDLLELGHLQDSGPIFFRLRR